MVKLVLQKPWWIYPLILLSLIVLGLPIACVDSDVAPEASIIEPTATPTTKPTGRGAGDTLQILYWQAPETLNPHLSSTLKDWDASRITYEPLASYDKDGRLTPFLAAEIPSLENGGVAADGKSVTWKLKQGIQWSDGEPFTANDVRFTYQFITNPEVKAESSSAYEVVESVEVLDDYTVKINFKDVNPAWPLIFVGPRGMILPGHIFATYNGPNAHGAPVNLAPVGTGPYRVVQYKPEEVLFLGDQLVQTVKIVYEPNPFFREADKPFFSRIELKGGGTAIEAARAVLKAGDIDYAWNLQVGAEQLAPLEAGGKGRLVSIFGANVERIFLNFTDPTQRTTEGETSSEQIPHPFLSDKKVRQAFAYAIDREAVAQLYGPAGQAVTNILVAPPTYQSPNIFYQYDPDKAKSLLDEAGWQVGTDGIREKDGAKMRVFFSTTANTLRQRVQEIVRENLNALGIEVRLNVVDAGDFFSDDPAVAPNDYRRFQADLEEYFDGNSAPDPIDYMRYWTSDQIPQKSNNWSGENVGRWRNPAYDALYQQVTTEITPEKRQQLFIQMNDLLVEDGVMIPLVHLAQVSGVGNSLEGVDLTPWDADTWNIKDWRRNSP